MGMDMETGTEAEVEAQTPAPPLEPCPFLPNPPRPVKAKDVNDMGRDRGEKFYWLTLDYAQVRWLERHPAHTLLMLNRALTCNLPDISLNGAVKPYHAVAWILQHRPPELFIGNPRRHWQHLATRMTPPFKDLRTWRAWACWYLSCRALDELEFPSDTKQIYEERVVEPRYEDIVENLGRLSPNDDVAAWQSALEWAEAHNPNVSPRTRSTATIRVIPHEELPTVKRLAHEIWPQAYSSIISEHQIAFMLGKMYDLTTMQRDMIEHEVVFALIEDGVREVGYCAWQPIEADSSAFLHKLYVLREYQGRGVGSQALNWVEKEMRERGLKTLRLRVNRNNHPAIRAYRRSGFDFESEVCSEIGEGFVMDDYVMSKGVE